MTNLSIKNRLNPYSANKGFKRNINLNKLLHYFEILYNHGIANQNIR